MLNGEELIQNSGNNSQNYQAINQNIVHNHYGLTDKEVKAISLELWRQNALKLGEEAASTALNRIEYFVERLVDEHLRRDENLSPAFKDPGMQMTLMLAQQTYVKSGDKEVADLLLEFLAKRAGCIKRNSRQVFFDECISVLSKLAVDQLDVMACVYLFKNTQLPDFPSIIDIPHVNQVVFKLLHELEYASSILKDIDQDEFIYKQLMYFGCVSTSEKESRYILDEVVSKYPALFCSGIDYDAMQIILSNYDFVLPSRFIIPAIIDDSKFQLNIMNREATVNVISEIYEANDFDDADSKKMIDQIEDAVAKIFDMCRRYGGYSRGLHDIFPNIIIMQKKYNFGILGRYKLSFIGEYIAKAHLMHVINSSPMS